MKDSWAAREGGMLEGNVRWVGHYDECVNSHGRNFSGKYCTTYYGFTYLPVPLGFARDITFDSCFPNSCNEPIIEKLMSNLTDIRVPILKTNCEVQDRSYGGFEIAFIIISAVFFILACAGTLTDVLNRSEKQKNTQTSTNSNKDASSINWLLCFSVVRNGEKILNTKQSSGNIKAINGIRTISTLWVILGHSLSFSTAYIGNYANVCQTVRSSFGYMPVLNGTFSVDSFFCIGGVLSSYLTLKHLNKTKGKLNYPIMLLQRYLRLTPLVLYCMVFISGMFKLIGSGPFWWPAMPASIEGCHDTWWTVLLYIQNLYPVSNACFSHTWYLACDMQFYILATIFIYALYRWPIVGVMQTVAVTMTSIAITWWLSYTSNQQPQAATFSIFCSILSRLIPISSNSSSVESLTPYQDRFKTDLYITPWCRIGAYSVGVLTGFVLFKTQRKIKIPKIANFLGWFTACGVGTSLIYGLYTATKEVRTIDNDIAAFYNGVSRPLWSACVAWVIVACSCGYGGPVAVFLDWSLFLPLSRLTFAAYLIHPFIVSWSILVQERYINFSNVWLTYYLLGNVVVSFILAFVAALLVEWPCQEVFKLVLPSAKPVAIKSEQVEEMNMDDQQMNDDSINHERSHAEKCSTVEGKLFVRFDAATAEKGGVKNLGFETDSTKL